jgi:hypothetical protein
MKPSGGGRGLLLSLPRLHDELPFRAEILRALLTPYVNGDSKGVTVSLINAFVGPPREASCRIRPVEVGRLPASVGREGSSRTAPPSVKLLPRKVIVATAGIARPPLYSTVTRRQLPSSPSVSSAPSYSLSASEPSDGRTCSAASKQTVRRMARLPAEGETRPHDTRRRAGLASGKRDAPGPGVTRLK